MDEYNELQQQAKLNQKRRDEKKAQYLDDSNDRLKTISERKVRTAFIGSLAKFEEDFGFLWGMTPEHSLTAEQEVILTFLRDNNLEDHFKNIWMKTREKVLTNGNNQIRALNEEFPQYTIEWNRYRTVLPVKGPSGVDS